MTNLVRKDQECVLVSLGVMSCPELSCRVLTNRWSAYRKHLTGHLLKNIFYYSFNSTNHLTESIFMECCAKERQCSPVDINNSPKTDNEAR